MLLIYDRRSFWFQFFLAIGFLILEVSMSLLRRGGILVSFWAGSFVGILLPLIVFYMLMAIIFPTLSPRLEARRVAQGRPVTITPKTQAQRSKNWVSPIPFRAWGALVLCSLLIVIADTNLVPRVVYGYHGTMGQETYAGWRQEPSPDGRWIAMDASPLNNDRARTLSMVVRDTGKTTAYPWDEHQGRMSWSHNSRYVAFGSQKILRVLNPNKGQIENVGLPSPSSFSFHPDGNLWVLCETGLWSWDPNNKIAKCLLSSKDINLCIGGYVHGTSTMVLSPDGAMIALRYNGQVRILETTQFHEVAQWTVPEHLTYNWNMRFLSGKKLLMAYMGAGNGDNTLLIFDAMTGSIQNKIEGLAFSSYPLEEVDFSSDGRWLVAPRNDHRVAVWSFEKNNWVWSAPYPSTNDDRCPRFSCDGSEITTLCFTEQFMFRSLGRCIRQWHWKVPKNV